MLNCEAILRHSRPILVLLPFLIAVVGHAQVQKAAKSTPPASDYSKEAFVIDKLRTLVVAADDGTTVREVSTEISILADAGVKTFAVLSFTYTSANEVVEVDYVRVRKPDGTLIKTPDYNIQDMPADVTRVAPMYSDIHEKHVAVKGLAVGDKLEYLIRYRKLKPEIPGHFWLEASFISDSIVKDEQLELRVPATKFVKVASPEFKPEIREEGAQRVYLWRHSQLNRPETPEAPKRVVRNPSVQVTTFRSWEDVGRWYASLQKEALVVTPEIQNKALELTKGLNTDEEKIRAIYNFVSLKIHYVGLDFGIGRYQPHPADDVLGNSYGDCKDKHTLLAALLKAAGYEAWPALIHSDRKLDPDVPSPAQFNHVITVVPRGNSYIWADTTPEVAPFGLLLAGLRDKQALVVPSEKPPMLIKTPADTPSPQQQFFTAEGTLGADGTYTGHVEQVYRGDVEVVLRTMFRRIPEAQWKDAVQKFSFGLGFGGEVSNVTVSPPEDTEKPLRLSYDYTRKSYSDWENHRFTLPLPPLGIESTKDSKKPAEAVYLGAPGEVIYQSKFTLPSGYVISPPKNLDISKPYAEYHATASLHGGVLAATRRLLIKKSEVPLKDWEDYRDFGKAVSDDEYQYLYLNGESAGIAGSPPANMEELDRAFREGTEAEQGRDFTRAEENFRKVIAGNPQYRGAHFNLALTLAAQNRLDEAVGEFHKEQEVNPTFAPAYEVPATILMLRRPEDAVLEWRKLLQVDPKNHDAALKLSTLLSGLNQDGDALAVLEAAEKESPDSPNLQIALAQMYVKTGQADKGATYYRKVIGSSPDSATVSTGTLNDAAYTLAQSKSHLDLARDFAEKAAAREEAESIATANSDRGLITSAVLATYWDTLGWVYFQAGDTARAEDYVRPAWLLDQRTEIGDHLGQIYERLGRKKEAAKAYSQAIAAPFNAPIPAFSVLDLAYQTKYNQSHEAVRAHYEKLTGQKFSGGFEIKRLPNGEWTKTPAEELRDEFTVKLANPSKLAGTAEFSLIFASAKKIEEARFRKGDKTLQSISTALQDASYPIAFPSHSQAKIARLVRVTCKASEACTAQLVPANQRLIFGVGVMNFPD